MSNEEPWVYDEESWTTWNGMGDDDRPPVTQEITEGHILFDPIEELFRKANLPVRWGAAIYLVTHHRWSGYSEYTITSTWEEVHVHHGGSDLHYDDMGAFMRALAEANPPVKRS